MKIKGGDTTCRPLTSMEATEANVALPEYRSSDKATPVSKRTVAKLKKAPDAPKRFKSAFIFFSTEKHKEIRSQLGDKGLAEKTTNVAKLVSEAWRDLDAEEREKWENMARRDKARYDVERAMYKGPWKVPANKRTPKDPSAPKRPMSAFLAFSNSRRAMVKRENPDATNAEISKTLSNMWKEAPDDLRQQYVDEEYEKRQQYKVAMADWRTKFEEEKRVERQEREEMALRAAEESEQSVSYRNVEDNNSEEIARRASYPVAEPDCYLSVSSQQQHNQLLSSSSAAASMYGAGMGGTTYFPSLGGFGNAFGSSMVPIVAYNQLGQLNNWFRANYAPNPASLNQLGQGLGVYPSLDGGNEALAYDLSMGQGSATAQLRNQGQYPFGGQQPFPAGWNFRGNG